MRHRKKRLSKEDFVQGVLAGNKTVLGRAITLVESDLVEDQHLSREVLQEILPYSGNSIRLGITGVPGVGKSTFIESLGQHITEKGKKLAVLTIDPSSQRSKGSILGDKTRMETLSHHPLAFIRPSASGSSLGGVNNHTRESVLLCEAAGYEIIFIETVGVGQSETTVHGMVDFFLLLMLAGAGDELQGIKKGIMEMADALVITKSDGNNFKMAKRAKAEYKSALHLFPPSPTGWFPPVLTCSALESTGIQEIWEVVEKYKKDMKAKGYFDSKRQQQQLFWMHENIRELLESRFYQHPIVSKRLGEVENEVGAGKKEAFTAAQELLQAFEEDGFSQKK
ncbi:methylmalonyl Co-A mutase-associated GTPase MeaB [Xanthovirga aplysinae]|uniref:methylmalonyl Co-A mutase-associated GTPase MeaB n=1 Tax=Xanthovirga aplysinae TaxID=2529853 RepID=UPI0012BC9D89|nr:methylmalonyl Co-A mutase-associated GTPase MeaB [Xanthovirga aplysinae]MTI30252.1 methylmalonyl Co-A mutase-associated GTPase MeaB [Xanthovirga aplysinae]